MQPATQSRAGDDGGAFLKHVHTVLPQTRSLVPERFATVTELTIVVFAGNMINDRICAPVNCGIDSVN